MLIRDLLTVIASRPKGGEAISPSLQWASLFYSPLLQGQIQQFLTWTACPKGPAQRSFGYDPLECPHCGCIRQLAEIWEPKRAHIWKTHWPETHRVRKLPGWGEHSTQGRQEAETRRNPKTLTQSRRGAEHLGLPVSAQCSQSPSKHNA